MKLALPSVIVLAFVIAGCGDEGGSNAKAEPPKDGLKELVKEDLEVGKPTKYRPKMGPIGRGDVVWVTYTGRFKNGEVFDSNDPKYSETPDPHPLSFMAGAPGVIKGWQDGILGMYPGGVRKLSIPWKLGYGETGSGKIRPYTDLYFEIKVLDYVKSGDEFSYGGYDVKKGTGPVAKPGSTVTFHTLIREANGKVIEDTRKKKKPVVAVIGKDHVLRAVDDALIDMQKGGVREISLPPPIGFPVYPDLGNGENQLYYVQIEVLDVK